MADEPVSRILCGVQTETSARCGDHSSRSRLAARLQQPTRGLSSATACAIAEGARPLARTLSSSRAGSPLLFGLAPRGVFHAPDIATGTVGSYPTFSPLPNDSALRRRLAGFPARCHRAAPPAVYSLWHYP